MIVLNIQTGAVTKQVHLSSFRQWCYALQDCLVVLGEKGEALISFWPDCDHWNSVDPRALEAGQTGRLYDRGDFWILAHRTTQLVAAGTGLYLGQLLDRPCDGIAALPNGDLLVVMDDAVARFRLGGHLSVLSSLVSSDAEEEPSAEGG